MWILEMVCLSVSCHTTDQKGMHVFYAAQFDGILKKITEFNNALLSDQPYRIAEGRSLLGEPYCKHPSPRVLSTCISIKELSDARFLPLVHLLRMRRTLHYRALVQFDYWHCCSRSCCADPTFIAGE